MQKKSSPAVLLMSILEPTVNSIFREYTSEFLSSHVISNHTKKVIRAITNCRTEALGGHIQECDNCGEKIIMYNSCRNRHCPQCQFMKKEKWIIDRTNDVLPFQYFHIVFTIPGKLNPIVYRNKKIIYKLLLDASKETLLSISEDEKYLGAKIGFFSILHTWGQKLNLHPHVHCVVPGGGYIAKKNKWIRSPKDYLVPVKVLNKRFRSLFLTGLKNLYKEKELWLANSGYEKQKDFRRLIDELFAVKWIVYIKESFKNSGSVIKYLSKYTHRIAISNHRILSVKNGLVTFSYKDYKNGNKKDSLSMPAIKFIKKFLLHVVPKRFVRIRYYEILSNSTKKEQVQKCRDYFSVAEKILNAKSWQEIYKSVTGTDIEKCKKCKIGNMVTVEILPDLSVRDGP